jgi:gentisate 1,2-dioxygenase
MSTEPRSEVSAPTSSFDSDLRAAELAPFWEAVDRNLEPRPATVPHCWRWADVRPLLYRAGDVVSLELAERRVLMLINPATRGDKRAVGNLYAGIQLVLPGEKASAHRHTAAALRFILEGGGGLTVVDGASVEFSQFDLVLTPAWAWHDHVNETSSPVAWLDALDSPFVRSLDAWFFEPHPDRYQTAVPDASEQVASLVFGWEQISSRLWESVAASGDGAAAVDYTHPSSGSDVLPTIRCRALGVAPGCRYGPTRRVGAAVYCVVEGDGSATVGSSSFELAFGDVFCVPSWYPLQIDSGSADRLSLFAYDDEPILRAFGLSRVGDDPVTGG